MADEIDYRLVDATGAPIRNAIQWDTGAMGVCAVPGCEHLTTMFGQLLWGGPLGYVCSHHRDDPDALDALIIAQSEHAKGGKS